MLVFWLGSIGLTPVCCMISLRFFEKIRVSFLGFGGIMLRLNSSILLKAILLKKTTPAIIRRANANISRNVAPISSKYASLK